MTMQAEFEHWYEHEFMGGLDGPGEWDVERNCYVQFLVHTAWKGYQAAYAAGQRAERERVEALQAEESPFHQRLCTGEGCTECLRCERVAAAIRNRKDQA